MSLIVHHLSCSQSERIPWLCEELGIPYTLKLHGRAPVFAPPELAALHPAGTAPVIQDGDITLAESGACIEYIARVHGGGRLFLDPKDPAYPDFLYWWHWANGSLQPAVVRMMAIRDDMKAVFETRMVGGLKMMDSRLKAAGVTWLAGSEFTAADVMVMFTLTTMRHWTPYSLEGYTGILAYLDRVAKREAYRTAMKKCEPDLEAVLGPDPPKKSYREMSGKKSD